MTIAPLESPNDKQKLVKDLNECEKHHEFWASVDSWLHEGLIVFIVCTGFASLAVGLYWSNLAWLAGILGAIPSFLATLALRLHCVDAANLHIRMAQQCRGFRYRLQFENEDVAKVSSDFRAADEKRVMDWKQITSTDKLTESREKVARSEACHKSAKTDLHKEDA